jgi:hypothetical protein
MKRKKTTESKSNRADLARAWANAPGRHPWDLVLEDYAVVQRQGGLDRSARIARVTNEETGEKELVVVSTDEDALKDLVGDLQEGLAVRAKLLHRPPEDELVRLMTERPVNGLLGPAVEETGRFRVEVLDAYGRELARAGSIASIGDAYDWARAWSASNPGFLASVLVYDRTNVVREYRRETGALRRVN